MLPCPCPVFYRYSDTTIEALEILDRDEKIDLDLILALIRYIVLNEEVSLTFQLWFECSWHKLAKFQTMRFILKKKQQQTEFVLYENVKMNVSVTGACL